MGNGLGRRSVFPLIFLIQSVCASANYNLSLDRPFTMRNPDPIALELELSRQIQSDGAMSFIYPRPCNSELDSSKVCGMPTGFSFTDSIRDRQLSVSPQAGYEYRYLPGKTNAYEIGLLTSGNSGPISFYLDARMFTEMNEDYYHASYDRELVDRQDEKASGTIAYSSYSRYRSTLSYDLPWARIAVGRDAVHWGPGLIANLSFNQNGVPFNQISWISHLGPISVLSIYGHLTIDSMKTVIINENNRSIYAHRYEWRATKNLLLGISEQMVTYNVEEPFAFVPIVPLFILKGSGIDGMNNGSISTDICYRLAKTANIYSEFLIDDLQSPSSLFDDYWGNKWAWMFGVHLTHAYPMGQAGLFSEYSRVEPWVYTHYIAGTAQTANAGVPLGNPLGPNSQMMVLRSYFKGLGGWTLSLQTDLIWKGTDLGSSINDTGVVETKPKVFLDGVSRPVFAIAPYAGYGWKSLYVEAQGRLQENPQFSARVQWKY